MVVAVVTVVTVLVVSVLVIGVLLEVAEGNFVLLLMPSVEVDRTTEVYCSEQGATAFDEPYMLNLFGPPQVPALLPLQRMLQVV